MTIKKILTMFMAMLFLVSIASCGGSGGGSGSSTAGVSNLPSSDIAVPASTRRATTSP